LEICLTGAQKWFSAGQVDEHTIYGKAAHVNNQFIRMKLETSSSKVYSQGVASAETNLKRRSRVVGVSLKIRFQLTLQVVCVYMCVHIK
jgi:hypothetical protein